MKLNYKAISENKNLSFIEPPHISHSPPDILSPFPFTFLKYFFNSRGSGLTTAGLIPGLLSTAFFHFEKSGQPSTPETKIIITKRNQNKFIHIHECHKINSSSYVDKAKGCPMVSSWYYSIK